MRTNQLRTSHSLFELSFATFWPCFKFLFLIASMSQKILDSSSPTRTILWYESLFIALILILGSNNKLSNGVPEIIITHQILNGNERNPGATDAISTKTMMKLLSPQHVR